MSLGALGLAAVAGVVSAAVDVPAPPPPKAPVLTRFIPEYPDAPFFALGDELVDEGTARVMAFALTPDAPRKVRERYAGIFTSQGLVVQERQRPGQDGELWLSAFVPGEEYLRTIGTSVDATGRTVIIASVSSMTQERAPKSPLPPRCAVLSSSGAKDGVVRRELSILDCKSEVREVVHYYDQVLQDAQRSTPGGETDGRGVYVQYEADGTFVSLVAAAGAPEPSKDGAPPIPHTRVTLVWEEQR